MITPTPEEIEAARDAINRDGSMCEMTMMLALLISTNAPLKNYCQRMAEHAPALIRNIQHSKPSYIPDAAVLDAFLRGVFMGGLNYGLRIGELRFAQTPAQAPTEIAQTELYAWIGEDELGSGEIGIKQAQVPAGMIPLVAIRREKIEKLYPQMEAQAARYGKRIRLCLFRFVEVVRETFEPKGK